MVQYEHKSVEEWRSRCMPTADDLAKDGWELVTVLPAETDNRKAWMIFRRKKRVR